VSQPKPLILATQCIILPQKLEMLIVQR
jgi:hypothetical protein